MGTNTPHLSLYKPDGSELVEVVEHLNENLDKVDAGVLDLDSRMGTVEGAVGVNNWIDYVPGGVYHGEALVAGVTWDHAAYLRLGGLVIVDFEFSIPNTTYNDGLVLAIELPFQNTGGMHGTALFTKSDGSKIPYFFIPSSTTFASAYSLKPGPPIEIDWEPPYPSTAYSATLLGGFTYRTNGVEI